MASDKSKEDLTAGLKNLNINATAKKDINILLIGESGTGKSTFINSIFNYLHYGTDFEKAKKEGKLTVLIPSQFTAYDKDGKANLVTIGSDKDKNEFLKVGESATQDVKTYTFKIRDTQTTIRLIDTPGMGDTDGYDKDDQNCENILSYISKLHHLHAICFLFKPNTTRLNVFFKYCIDQILSRLEKSASRNIVFVFTNTRGHDYSSGDTLPILQRVVKDIRESPPNVEIPLNKNLFCLDNEAFRYLTAVKEGVEFTKEVEKSNKVSWTKSTQECRRLISYVSELTPHFVKHTSAINEARRMIYQLSQPIADIAQHINDNLLILDRHKETLSKGYNDLSELKKILYMPVITLKVITLTQPFTVCKDRDCGEVYKIGNVNKWHYKKPCHDPCFLTNVPKEIIGSPELASCEAIDKSTQMCKKCGHHFTTHMHVYYTSKTVEEKQIDNAVLKDINTKELAVENAKKIIKCIENKKKELEEELKMIVHCNAQFAHFLKHNAIVTFSDSYVEYIRYLIIRERSLGEISDPQVVRNLEDLIIQHEKIKQVFEEALKSSAILGDASNNVTPQKIQKSVDELFKLKYSGDKIKELYSSQKQSRSKEHSNTEYVHKTAFSQSFSQDKKADNKTQNKNKNAKGNQPKNSNNTAKNQRPKTPPPSYDSAIGGPSKKHPPPNRSPPLDTYSPNYAFHPPSHPSYVPPPPPHDSRYHEHYDRSRYPVSRPGYDDRNPRGYDDKNARPDQPTSNIQVNLTVSSKDLNSGLPSVSATTSRPDDPYRQRDGPYPPDHTHRYPYQPDRYRDGYYDYDARPREPYYPSRDGPYRPPGPPPSYPHQDYTPYSPAGYGRPPPRNYPLGDAGYYERPRNDGYHERDYSPRDPRDFDRGHASDFPPPPRDHRDFHRDYNRGAPPAQGYHYDYGRPASGVRPPSPPRGGYLPNSQAHRHPSSSSQKGENFMHKGGNQPQSGGNRGRGNAFRGRGGINRKNVNKRKNVNHKNDGNDSDTSVASSKK